jgi:cytidylate kinase
VICPEAEVKLFVTASDEVRARRRFLELAARGDEVTEAGVLADLRARDARDSARETAPLRAAEDAVILDTSAMTIDEAVAAAVAVIDRARGAR